jgi:hypothetical protein
MNSLAMEGRRFGRFGGEKERWGREEEERRRRKVFAKLRERKRIEE